MAILGKRVSPFYAQSNSTTPAAKNRLIYVDPTDNTAAYAADGANAITIDDAVAEFNWGVAYVPAGDMLEERLLDVAGTVAVGDLLKSDAAGKGVVTLVSADAQCQAVTAGVAGDTIVVRMFQLA